MSILRTALRVITSVKLFPGAITVAAVLGLIAPPAEMKLDEKMAAIGVPWGTALAKAILLPVGLGQMFIPINHFLLDGALDLLYAIMAVSWALTPISSELCKIKWIELDFLKV